MSQLPKKKPNRYQIWLRLNSFFKPNIFLNHNFWLLFRLWRFVELSSFSLPAVVSGKNCFLVVAKFIALHQRTAPSLALEFLFFFVFFPRFSSLNSFPIDEQSAVAIWWSETFDFYFASTGKSEISQIGGNWSFCSLRLFILFLIHYSLLLLAMWNCGPRHWH